ncbi:oligoribonuclease-like isoform X1 [Bombus affinis]|uniref:oligoribonuclease-like isoform X1 n=2 Tax=Bombus affinis TaxID=309941 RepID=UPI0021B81F66|nr:oligoribonuclease-like isoform X1 [Bombus affinis]
MKTIFAYCLKWSKNCLQITVPRYFHTVKSPELFMNTNMGKSNLNDYIVWLDMEMSGTDVNTSQILEIACLITNKDLKVVSEDLNIIIHQPDEILNNMNYWCMATHQKTELINESRLSKTTVEDAEQIVLKYLKTYIEKEATCPLAGSSVYVDRMFLYKYMPLVNNYLHYRIIDTSTIKELIKRWNINVPIFKKNHVHRALPDVKESIRELQCYKNHIFDLCIRS